MFRSLVLALGVAATVSLVHAQAGRPNGDGTSNLKPLKPGDDGGPPGKETCDPEFRTFDGRCTNPKRKEWGSTRQPLFSYIRGSTSRKAKGKGLKSAREISNILSKQDSDVLNRRRLSEMVTFFGQFVDHNIVASSANKKNPMPIPIPEDDPIFGNFTNNVLPFDRSFRGPVKEGKRAERPINSLSSLVDLAAVYGPEPRRTKALRSDKQGAMETGPGNSLPLNNAGLFNAPVKDAKFFLAGDHRANEHPVLFALHTIFLREHNLLAGELRGKFPDWDKERVFQMARQINIVQFQKIVFAEFYPVMTGRNLPPYKGFKKNVNPGVSDIFSTAAYRIGHTMVGNVLNRRGKGNSRMPPVLMKDIFFQPATLLSENIESFVRGAIFNRAQEVDLLVHSALRNFLFTRVSQESGFDLVALNIQRGRDHAIPTYQEIRKIFGIPLARSFKDISNSRSVQNKLVNAYGTVNSVEAWPGLVAEQHVNGASMGRTMLACWREEFERLRDGDRFFYLQPNIIPKNVLDAIPRITKNLRTKELLKAIIIRNTDISPSELKGSVWKSSV